MSSSFSKLRGAVLAIAVLAAFALPASAGASIKLGAYTPGAPASASALSEYASMVGRQPEIVMWYRDFGLPLMYTNEVANLRRTGQTPMLTWEPYDTSLADIASGELDSYLHESAAIARDWGGEMMIRFAHEMNGTWYPWAATNQAPATYVAAWQHIVSVFRADGASNVKWVWSPNVQESGKYPIAPAFPGDEWVDYIGLDGYNWGTGNGERWESAGSVFKASYDTVTAMSAKPVIIAETASSELGGDKAAWIRSTYLTEIPRDFPRVTGVVWFNKTQEDDWRINSSAASLDAYRSVTGCDIYGGSQPCVESNDTEETRKGRRPRRKPAISAVHVPARVPPAVPGQVSFRVTQPGEVQIAITPRGRPGARTKIVRKAGKGRLRTPLSRVLRGRRLAAGRYRVVMIARNDQGQRSRTRHSHFRVVARNRSKHSA